MWGFLFFLSCSGNLSLEIELDSGLIEGFESEDGTLNF